MPKNSNEPQDEMSRLSDSTADPNQEELIDNTESAAQIRELGAQLMREANNLRVQVDQSQLKQGLMELKSSTDYFRSIAEAALTRPAIEPITAGTGRDCGCSDRKDGCDPSQLPSCCVELYIRQVDVGRSDIGNLTRLECIVCVKGEHSWGMTDTGVAGFISLEPKTGPVPLNCVIERHCVPCKGTKLVPLWFQCREIDLVGKDEVGSERGAITLRCDCEIPDYTQRVVVTGSALGTFEIFITVGARVIPGGCC